MPTTEAQKVAIPLQALILEEALFSPEIAYSSAHQCDDCNQSILFNEDVKVEWPTDGPRNYYFGPLPGYECKECHLIYIPENVLQLVTQIASEEFAQAEPSDILQVAQNVRLAVGAYINRQSPQ